jgi:hypothetical protein
MRRVPLAPCISVPCAGDPQRPAPNLPPETAPRTGCAGGVVHVWRGAAAHCSEREGVEGLCHAHDALAALLATLGLPPGTLICLASQARGRPGAGLRAGTGVCPGACVAGARRAPRLGAAPAALRAPARTPALLHHRPRCGPPRPAPKRGAARLRGAPRPAPNRVPLVAGAAGRTGGLSARMSGRLARSS